MTSYLGTFHAVTIELIGNSDAALQKYSYKKVFWKYERAQEMKIQESTLVNVWFE